MNLAKRLIVRPGERVRLKKRDPEENFGLEKNSNRLEKRLARLREYQHLLYADRRHSLLIVLQALDAGGKDGTIRHVMSGVNPQGCRVSSFKAPTTEELDHDFLWRIHKEVPGRGMIGIFNRSHYEDVLVVRVHDLVPKSIWKERYDHINRFEEMLAESGVTILKFFLHITKDEQLRRFQERLSDPTKNWKLSLPDFKEREHWDEYMEAYEEALSRCSTTYAPWYVIPANNKWFRDYAICEIVSDTLRRMRLRFPPTTIDVTQIKLI
jgi:PPK2 family polyphosphate:nucleotide phosphotransferase